MSVLASSTAEVTWGEPETGAPDGEGLVTTTIMGTCLTAGDVVINTTPSDDTYQGATDTVIVACTACEGSVHSFPITGEPSFAAQIPGSHWTLWASTEQGRAAGTHHLGAANFETDEEWSHEELSEVFFAAANAAGDSALFLTEYGAAVHPIDDEAAITVGGESLTCNWAAWGEGEVQDLIIAGAGCPIRIRREYGDPLSWAESPGTEDTCSLEMGEEAHQVVHVPGVGTSGALAALDTTQKKVTLRDDSNCSLLADCTWTTTNTPYRVYGADGMVIVTTNEGFWGGDAADSEIWFFDATDCSATPVTVEPTGGDVQSGTVISSGGHTYFAAGTAGHTITLVDVPASGLGDLTSRSIALADLTPEALDPSAVVATSIALDPALLTRVIVTLYDDTVDQGAIVQAEIPAE